MIAMTAGSAATIAFRTAAQSIAPRLPVAVLVVEPSTFWLTEKEGCAIVLPFNLFTLWRAVESDHQIDNMRL
jgi:hypothetical protein